MSVSRPTLRVIVKFPSEASRSIFKRREFSYVASLEFSFVVEAAALALSSDGRKKGAFSGAFGGSMGLLRCCHN